MRINGKTTWDFACAWYGQNTIARGIHLSKGMENAVPRNVDSPEFAEWMTEQYRLAMNKGLELGYQAGMSEARKNM